MSGFTGRGVGVGDDRGKCTPNFVHPFRLSAPPSFHFCPGLPLPRCGHLKVHHPGFCPGPHLSVSSSFLLSAAPFSLPVHWHSLGFTLFYLTPSLMVPHCCPRFSSTYVSKYPCSFSFLGSYVTSFPPVCLPSLCLCHPAPHIQPTPKILQPFPQIKKTLSFFIWIDWTEICSPECPGKDQGDPFLHPTASPHLFQRVACWELRGERAAAFV